MFLFHFGTHATHLYRPTPIVTDMDNDGVAGTYVCSTVCGLLNVCVNAYVVWL